MRPGTLTFLFFASAAALHGQPVDVAPPGAPPPLAAESAGGHPAAAPHPAAGAVLNPGAAEAPAAPEETPRPAAAAFTPPKKPDRGGFRNLAENSPFTVRPSTEILTEETPFPDLALIGYMVLGGKMNAWVQAADSEDPVQLVEGIRDEASGMLLVGIKGAEDMFTAQAEIEANGKKGTLKFTEQGITVSPGAGAPKPVANNPQGQQGGQPGQPPGQPGQPGQGGQAGQQGQSGQGVQGGQQGQAGQAQQNRGNRSGGQPNQPGQARQGGGAGNTQGQPAPPTPRRRIILPK